MGQKYPKSSHKKREAQGKPEETIFCLVCQKKTDCEWKVYASKTERKVIHFEGTKKILYYQQPSPKWRYDINLSTSFSINK